jgi:hypothetical protein
MGIKREGIGVGVGVGGVNVAWLRVSGEKT